MSLITRTQPHTTEAGFFPRDHVRVTVKLVTDAKTRCYFTLEKWRFRFDSGRLHSRGRVWILAVAPVDLVSVITQLNSVSDAK